MTIGGVLVFDVPQQGIAARSEVFLGFLRQHLLPAILPTAVLTLEWFLFGMRTNMTLEMFGLRELSRA